jgi:alkyl hydroperoxide reductase subunit AhpC
MPTTFEDLMDFMHEFDQTGSPCFIGSSNATHAIHEKWNSSLKNHHLVQGCDG